MFWAKILIEIVDKEYLSCPPNFRTFHYKRKGCFKYSPRDKILSNDLFRRFSVGIRVFLVKFY